MEQPASKTADQIRFAIEKTEVVTDHTTPPEDREEAAELDEPSTGQIYENESYAIDGFKTSPAHEASTADEMSGFDEETPSCFDDDDGSDDKWENRPAVTAADRLGRRAKRLQLGNLGVPRQALIFLMAKVFEATGGAYFQRQLFEAICDRYGIKRTFCLQNALFSAMLCPPFLAREQKPCTWVPGRTSWCYSARPQTLDDYLRANFHLTIEQCVELVSKHYCANESRAFEDEQGPVGDVEASKGNGRENVPRLKNAPLPKVELPPPTEIDAAIAISPDLVLKSKEHLSALVVECMKKMPNGCSTVRDIWPLVSERLSRPESCVYWRVNETLNSPPFQILGRHGNKASKVYALRSPRPSVQSSVHSDFDSKRMTPVRRTADRDMANSTTATPPSTSRSLAAKRPRFEDEAANSASNTPESGHHPVSIDSYTSDESQNYQLEVILLKQRIQELERKLAQRGTEELLERELQFNRDLGRLEVPMAGGGSVQQLVGTAQSVRMAFSVTHDTPVIGARLLNDALAWRVEKSDDGRQIKIDVAHNEIYNLLQQ